MGPISLDLGLRPCNLYNQKQSGKCIYPPLESPVTNGALQIGVSGLIGLSRADWFLDTLARFQTEAQVKSKTRRHNVCNVQSRECK